jgi:hypothetical protein
MALMGMGATAPQTLSPPPSLIAVPPPLQPYNPPNPANALTLLRNLLTFLLHVLLRPFSARVLPAAANNSYALDFTPPPPPTSTAVVLPSLGKRRSRSKSPSSSPSSMTMTEGTLDGSEGVRRRMGAVKSGFEVEKIRIRAGNSGVSSKLEGWAKEAFGMS